MSRRKQLRASTIIMLHNLAKLQINSVAAVIVEKTVEFAQLLFGQRLRAVYLLGSLARGGFSQHYSDVDIALILSDPLTDADSTNISTLTQQIHSLQLPLVDRISIFWTSLCELTHGGVGTNSRLPAMDRIDLLQHGCLIWGEEIRSTDCMRPSTDVLEREGIVLALEKLNHPRIIRMFKNPALLFAEPGVPASKIVLFPIRLMYTALTGCVEGNMGAAEYYCRQYTDRSAQLVQVALEWRQHLPDLMSVDVDLIKESLPVIYRRLILLYQQKMQQQGAHDLVAQLTAWQQAIDDECGGS